MYFQLILTLFSLLLVQWSQSFGIGVRTRIFHLYSVVAGISKGRDLYSVTKLCKVIQGTDILPHKFNTVVIVVQIGDSILL